MQLVVIGFSGFLEGEVQDTLKELCVIQDNLSVPKVEVSRHPPPSLRCEGAVCSVAAVTNTYCPPANDRQAQ